MGEVGDREYEMVWKLGGLLKRVWRKLVEGKKGRIEGMMKEELKMKLVIYGGYMGRVEL